MEGWSNPPKIKLEMQEMCSTCDKLQQHNEWLYNKCQSYELQIESLVKINAENGSSLQESHQKIEELNQVNQLLKQQIAEKIAEISMLRVECDGNKEGKVEENNLPDIDKFLEIKMEIPNEEDLREKENGKEQDVESYSEMENSENSEDSNQAFEEDEDEETDTTLDEKQVKTCAWMVCNDKGTSKRCRKAFPSSEDLASHFKNDHLNADLSDIYVCRWDGCKRNGEPFKERNNLTVHFRAHSGERPYRCPVEGCDKAFAQLTSLNSHSGTAHSKISLSKTARSKAPRSKTLIPCVDPDCPKTFSTKGHMMIHYRASHTGVRKEFACPVEDCGRVFRYNHKLRTHLGTHRPYQCKVPRCYQSFESKQSLDEHSETHEPVEGHECTFDGCGRKFPDARAVEKHVKATHTGETPYVCPYECGKAFANERGLNRHVNVHTRMGVPYHFNRTIL